MSLPVQPTPIDPPPSYATLNLPNLKLSHVPESSPDPTPIIIVSLHRPQKYNAFDTPMMESLEKVFSIISLDDRVKCAILTGSGKMFCAGADLQRGFKDGEGMEEGQTEHRDGGGRVALAVHRCQKPVIAAINGSAVGVGMTMTLPAVIKIAYKEAKCGFVFARRGLVSEGASSFFLPRLVGFSRALHLVTTGAVYKANDKLLDGLFSEVLDSPEAVLSRAIEIAQDVVKNTSVVSNFLIRELMWRGPQSAEEAHLLDSQVLFTLRSSTDNDEGVKSFLEKRDPKFTGTMGKDAPNVWPWYTPIDTRNRQKATKKLTAKI